MLLAAGLAGGAAAQGVLKYDGQYVGELALTGIVNGNCTQPPSGSAYPLTISGGAVRFKYVPRFDTTLSGKVSPDGSFRAGVRIKSGLVTMTGQIDAATHTLKAAIVSPSCNYSFQTKN